MKGPRQEERRCFRYASTDAGGQLGLEIKTFLGKVPIAFGQPELHFP